MNVWIVYVNNTDRFVCCSYLLVKSTIYIQDNLIDVFRSYFSKIKILIHKRKYSFYHLIIEFIGENCFNQQLKPKILRK